MKHRTMFLRDNYTLSAVPGEKDIVAGNPVGCIAIKVHENRRSAEYQVSVLNPLDRFDRAIARQLALGRLAEAPFTVRLPSNASMYDITLAVMSDINLDESAPSRARRAAKLWIKYHV